MQKYYFDRKAVFLIKKSEIILFCCFVLLVVSLFSTARGQEQNHAAKQTPQETFRKSVITPMFGIPRVENANIKGKELTISTLLEGVSSPAERYQRLDAYWKLAEKLALYNVSLTYMSDIQYCVDRYPEKKIPLEMVPFINATQNLATQKKITSEINLLSAQYAFANRIKNNGNASLAINNPGSFQEIQHQILAELPLPVDIPSLEQYNTRFDEIARQRRTSQAAYRLSVTLPIQYDTIQSRILQTMQEQQNLFILIRGNDSNAILFNALNRYTEAKIAMLHAIIEYNRMIAAYVAETVDGSVQGSQLLSTLNQNNRSPRDLSSPQTEEKSAFRHRIIRGQMLQFPQSLPYYVAQAQDEPATGNANPNTTETLPASTESVPQAAPPSSPQSSDPAPTAGNPAKTNVPPGGNTAQSTGNPAEANSSDNDPASGTSLSPEEQTVIRELTQYLFKTGTLKSGAGDSPIVEIPFSLQDAFQRVPLDSRHRLEVGELYWTLRRQIAELEIEKQTLDTVQLMVTSFENNIEKSQKGGKTPDPQLLAITGLYHGFLFDETARVTEKKIEIRNSQISLIQRTGQSVENGWPIPVSMPHCGPTYRLELQNAQRTFTSMTESVLIPEKIHAVQEIGLTMGPLEYLFRPQMELNSQDEACLYLATLQNKRDQALAYVRMVESLNDSILKYVLDYSSTPLPNDILVKCLLGTR